MRAAYAIAVSAFVLLAGVSCGGSDADPASYLLRLDDDGSFIARADCKRVAGTYSLSGSDLTLELTPTAKRTCGKDSRAVGYIALLRRVATYDLYEKGSLALGLKENVG